METDLNRDTQNQGTGRVRRFLGSTRGVLWMLAGVAVVYVPVFLFASVRMSSEVALVVALSIIWVNGLCRRSAARDAGGEE